ncbi:MAG: D-alanine--D-alanine ligase [Alphaproteobacteria bacterium]|nr:D-alanine--D-alanine ligase [Alphaproteobacteria bacterium]MBV9540878.1 D-alanine--D-alanine ligase [Alphaproteobacteria bacterium]MBV9904537.1 D-alanine--D-alanine ligase [Alphaproteobacteria bacterium]
MRIGITYDLRSDYLALGYSAEETAEFDAEVTIDGLCAALTNMGYEVDRIGTVKKLIERVAAGDRWPCVFNYCEGMYGLSREAQAPAVLEAYNIPFVFSDALTMAVTLDKAMCKRIVRDCGIPTAAFAVIERLEDADRIDLPYPLFLKPVAEGSGKGIGTNNRVSDKAALKASAADLLARFKQPVLVETYLPGREFTVAITGTGDDATVLGVSEIVPLSGYHGDGYGLVNKEDWDGRLDIVGAPPADAKASGEVALAAWRALRCRDGGRIDIKYDGNNVPNFIEVNPLAGLRPEYSDMCFISTREGLSYQDLIGKIMASFWKRHPECKP